jgi:hypothetical protein
MNVRKEGPIGHGGAGRVLVEILVIPPRRHPGCEERFYLGGQVQRVLANRVVEGFNPESIAHGQQQLVRFVPEHKGEFPAQVSDAMRAELFVEVQGDLAIRARAEAVTALFQLTTLALDVIKLAVHDAADALILVRDGLVAGRQVDDAQPSMAEPDALVG